MNDWLQTDWGRMFRPEMSLPEVLIRAVLVYGSVVLLLRVILRRQAGKVSLSDLLVVALVAGVCRNPLVRDAYSVTDGLLVVGSILFLSYAMDWLSYHVPLVHKMLHPEPVALVRDGEVLHENLRRELITESQLLCKLRRHGVNDPQVVAEAFIEGDGHVSVVPKATEAMACRSDRVPRSLSTGDPAAEGRRQAKDASNGAGTGHVTRAEPPVPDDASVDPEVHAFRLAAEELRQRLAWHRDQIAACEKAATEVRQLLSKHKGNGAHPDLHVDR
jgi:uncharacterized membrane protein YcaP (DUF421 family)